MFSNPQPERTIIPVDEPRRVDSVVERSWQKITAIRTPPGDACRTERKEVLEVFRKGKGVTEELAEMELLLLWQQRIEHSYSHDSATARGSK